MAMHSLTMRRERILHLTTESQIKIDGIDSDEGGAHMQVLGNAGLVIRSRELGLVVVRVQDRYYDLVPNLVTIVYLSIQ